uniref:Uncharacterized protein n=1 Tax=Oryza punctata TaxID=4537 RepID=A0A0E0LQW5_ORYPU
MDTLSWTTSFRRLYASPSLSPPFLYGKVSGMLAKKRTFSRCDKRQIELVKPEDGINWNLSFRHRRYSCQDVGDRGK